MTEKKDSIHRLKALVFILTVTILFGCVSGEDTSTTKLETLPTDSSCIYLAKTYICRFQHTPPDGPWCVLAKSWGSSHIALDCEWNFPTPISSSSKPVVTSHGIYLPTSVLREQR